MIQKRTILAAAGLSLALSLNLMATPSKTHPVEIAKGGGGQQGGGGGQQGGGGQGGNGGGGKGKPVRLA